MIQQDMVLDRIQVTRSPISRPDSDCWDVNVAFFNPRKGTEVGRRLYRATIDVADSVPVIIGEVRSWFDYNRL